MTTARSSHTEAAEREEPASGPHRVVPGRPTEQRDKASVQRYFERYAEAATNGDARAMNELWGVPAFVLGRSEAAVVESEQQVGSLAERARRELEARGATRICPEIQCLDWAGSDLVVATVRWPYLNERGDEVGEEAASYTLLRGEDGSYKLRSLLLRTLTKRK